MRPKFYAVTVLALAGLAAAAAPHPRRRRRAPSYRREHEQPSASSSVNLSSVTLNVGDQKGTGAEAVLTAAGLLNTLPFHVHWSDFTSGPPMLEAMASGAVDIAASATHRRLRRVRRRAGRDRRRPPDQRDQDAVVVPKNSPITSIQQLKGKKIAYGSGSSANYNLLTVLTKAG